MTQQQEQQQQQEPPSSSLQEREKQTQGAVVVDDGNASNIISDKQGATTTTTAEALSSESSSSSSVFVNQGLQKWEEARKVWLNHQNNSNNNNYETDVTTAIPMEVDEIIDVIFSPRWRSVPTPTAVQTRNTNGTGTTTKTHYIVGGEDLADPPRRFPQNVPLPQMVDILVDLWEAEGLDV